MMRLRTSTDAVWTPRRPSTAVTAVNAVKNLARIDFGCVDGRRRASTDAMRTAHKPRTIRGGPKSKLSYLVHIFALTNCLYFKNFATHWHAHHTYYVGTLPCKTNIRKPTISNSRRSNGKLMHSKTVHIIWLYIYKLQAIYSVLYKRQI